MEKKQQKEPPKKNKNDQKKEEPFSTKIELSEKAYGIYKILKNFKTRKQKKQIKDFILKRIAHLILYKKQLLLLMLCIL